MKKLVVPPAGPPGPIPGDPTPTEPPKSQPDHALSADPNILPPPPATAAPTEEFKERRKDSKR